MVLLVLMALTGAALGAAVRPRLMAVPVAIGLAEALRGLASLLAPAAVDNLAAPWWSQWALGIEEDPFAGYLPLLGVSGGAALLAAVLTMLTSPRAPRPVGVTEATKVRRRVVKGRYVRADGMIEERARQAEAEARQKALLGL